MTTRLHVEGFLVIFQFQLRSVVLRSSETKSGIKVKMKNLPAFIVGVFCVLSTGVESDGI